MPYHSTHPSPNIKISVNYCCEHTLLMSFDHTHNSQSGVPVQRSFFHVQYHIQALAGHVLCENGTRFMLAVNGCTKELYHTGTLELAGVGGGVGRREVGDREWR